MYSEQFESVWGFSVEAIKNRQEREKSTQWTGTRRFPVWLPNPFPCIIRAHNQSVIIWGVTCHLIEPHSITMALNEYCELDLIDCDWRFVGVQSSRMARFFHCCKDNNCFDCGNRKDESHLQRNHSNKRCIVVMINCSTDPCQT